MGVLACDILGKVVLPKLCACMLRSIVAMPSTFAAPTCCLTHAAFTLAYTHHTLTDMRAHAQTNGGHTDVKGRTAHARTDAQMNTQAHRRTDT